MLNNYGIKHTGTYTSQFGIMKMTLSGWKKNEDPGTKMSWTLVDEIRQRQWVNQPETLKPFSFAPHEAPWSTCLLRTSGGRMFKNCPNIKGSKEVI